MPQPHEAGETGLDEGHDVRFGLEVHDAEQAQRVVASRREVDHGVVVTQVLRADVAQIDRDTGRVIAPEEKLNREDALRAATIDGAYLTFDEEIKGSIEPGKAADLCAVDFGAPGMQPCYSPVSHLVYAAGRENVSHVWVAGKMLLTYGEIAENPPFSMDKIPTLWQDRLISRTRG